MLSEALIQCDPLYRNARDIDAPRVRHALSLIFPGDNDGLAGLEPDLIGEHHVAGVINDALLDGCLQWSGDDRARRQHILTVLNRATRAEHGAVASRAAAQLERLVRTQAAKLAGDLIKVALETPGQLLGLCPALEAQLDSLDEPVLAAIDAELPAQSLTLMELSLSVAIRRADRREIWTSSPRRQPTCRPTRASKSLTILPRGLGRSAPACPTSGGARRRWPQAKRPSTSEDASCKRGPMPSCPMSP
jgi:hypothetical protein